MDVEALPVHELLADLRAVKLRKEHRLKVVQAKAAFEKNGSLPTRLVIELREIYRRYSKAIRTLHESRERARVSMAKERLRKQGVTRQDLESRRDRRISGLRDKVEDLGF
jgi:hypothetical protein